MRQFKWHGINALGKEVKGVSAADSGEQLKTQLLSEGIAVVGYGIQDQARKRSRIIAGIIRRISARKPLRIQELAHFFSSVALLLESGLDLLRALRICRQQASASMAEIITSLYVSIEKGSSFSQSLQNVLPAPDDVMINLIAAGERAGKLAPILKRYAHHLYQQHAWRKKIRQAVALPVCTLGGSFVLLMVIFTVLIPRFTAFFSFVDAPVPWVTRVIVSISDFLCGQYRIILFLCLAFFVLARLVVPSSRWAQNFLSNFLLHMPLMGRLVLYRSLGWFLETLLVLLDSGLALHESLQLAKRSIRIQPLKQACDKVAAHVASGTSFAQGIKTAAAPFFSPYLISLIDLGEQSGSLQAMLGRAIAHIEGVIDRQMNAINTVIGPLLMLMVGVLVMVILVAVYLPIFNLASHI